MIRLFTATLSPVDPTDKVTHREFHVFDGATPPNETILLLDADASDVDASLDDAAGSGSCYLIDANDAGPSAASAAFPLVVPVTPPRVPKQPTVLSVTFADAPPATTPVVVDRRIA